MVRVRGITEHRRFNCVSIADFEGQLARVIVRICSAVDFAVVDAEKPGTSGWSHMLMHKIGIEISKVEKVPLQGSERNIATQFRASFVCRRFQAPPDSVCNWKSSALAGVACMPRALKKPATSPKSLGSSGLSNNLNDSAAGMPVLRLKATRLDLTSLTKERLMPEPRAP